jgi:O-methyltransferase domain/Dimerisation domain
MTESQPPPWAQMVQLLGGFQVSQAVYAVAKLGIATALFDGPRPLDELARVTGTHPGALRRLVRTLTPLGIFRVAGEEVEVTEFGAMLAEGHPGSMHASALFWMETHYLPFSELTHAMRTGESGATRYLGQPFFDWIVTDSRLVEVQNNAFAAVTRLFRAGLFDGYQLPDAGKTVADIGGADGSLLAELLQNDPDRNGIVFDLPQVVVGATSVLAERGLSDRVQAVGGDFFADVPAADIYLLSYVLHDWGDDACLRILRSIAKAAAPGARLLVIENVVPEGDGPHMAKASDLIMLAMLDGARERTAAEYTKLLAGAGFTVDRILPTPTTFSLIEATLG